MDRCWKKLVEKIEEEVPDKCKVDESKRGACRGQCNRSHFSVESGILRSAKV